MRKVYQNPAVFERRAKTLKDSLETTHTLEKIQAQVVDTIDMVLKPTKEEAAWQEEIETVETL